VTQLTLADSATQTDFPSCSCAEVQVTQFHCIYRNVLRMNIEHMNISNALKFVALTENMILCKILLVFVP